MNFFEKRTGYRIQLLWNGFKVLTHESFDNVTKLCHKSIILETLDFHYFEVMPHNKKAKFPNFSCLCFFVMQFGYNFLLCGIFHCAAFFIVWHFSITKLYLPKTFHSLMKVFNVPMLKIRNLWKFCRFSGHFGSFLSSKISNMNETHFGKQAGNGPSRRHI